MHCQRFTPTPPWAPVAARGAGIAFLAFAAAARHRRPGTHRLVPPAAANVRDIRHWLLKTPVQLALAEPAEAMM
jgi:hypothetical protein